MSGAGYPRRRLGCSRGGSHFSRGGEDEPDARDDDLRFARIFRGPPDDQLERQCGEWCVPLDELDNNDTSASDVDYFKTVVWTAAMGTAVDAVLAVVKFAAGFAVASSALVADAVHSASDVVSDLVVIAAARYASAPPDARYPYGRMLGGGRHPLRLRRPRVGGVDAHRGVCREARRRVRSPRPAPARPRGRAPFATPGYQERVARGHVERRRRVVDVAPRRRRGGDVNGGPHRLFALPTRDGGG